MFKRPQSGSTTPSAEEVNTLLGVTAAMVGGTKIVY